MLALSSFLVNKIQITWFLYGHATVHLCEKKDSIQIKLTTEYHFHSFISDHDVHI